MEKRMYRVSVRLYADGTNHALTQAIRVVVRALAEASVEPAVLEGIEMDTVIQECETAARDGDS